MVKVGPTILGDGKTKICVPLVGKTTDALVEECKYLQDKACDLAELRIDFFEGAEDVAKVKELLAVVRPELANKGLLFTWRTKGEGGELAITVDDYFNLLDEVIQTGNVDAIDIEYFFDQTRMVSTIELAKKHNVAVIMSNHDFDKTPAKEEITSRLIGMKKAGADVAKLACMPQSAKDVLTLLTATEEVKAQYPDEPIITMSMGKLGVVSRICGSVFGNGMSFGAAKQGSAPGQVEIGILKDVLAIVD
ncbi:MAG: type I 3-dehydroquinate dehydratase [Parabacteroides sp.]|nr:type I 3-dehydroquinate dehydratase [Parabacteroides sp.]